MRTRDETGTAERACVGGDDVVTVTAPNLQDAVWETGKRVEPMENKDGSQEYTSQYGTVTETISKLEVSEIRIKSQPTNTMVVEGMPLDTRGLAIETVYSDGSSVEITDYTLSGYNTSMPSKQTVTVTYKGLTTSFDITVIEKSLTGIAVTQMPDRLEYIAGETLDTTGMVITASYNNNTAEKIEDYDITELTDEAGEQIITVSYGGFTDSFTVTVTAPMAPPQTVETPLINVADYYEGKKVTISSATGDAEIRYTTDGTEPDENSWIYSAPFTLSETTTVKAKAYKESMMSSGTAGKTVGVETVSAPRFSYPSGEVNKGTIVTLTCATDGADIYYTTEDALTPETAKLYNGGIAITEDTTIKAIVAKKGFKYSEVTDVSYTVTSTWTEGVLLSPGYVDCTAGEEAFIPVYLFASGDVTDYRMTINYDSERFECVSVMAAEDIAASTSAVIGEGTVTIRCSGGVPINDKICLLELKVKDDAPDGNYKITISDAAVTMANQGNAYIKLYDGMITLGFEAEPMSTPTPTPTEYSIKYTDENNAEGAVITAPEAGTCYAVLAAYKDGALTSVEIKEVTFDTAGEQTVTAETFTSDGANTVKAMLWESPEGMKPLCGADTITK